MGLMTLSEYPVPIILPLIGKERDEWIFIAQSDGKEYKTSVGSLRLQCFKANQACVWCGREGNIFLLQTAGGPKPHLNMYHREPGELVLMTRDHVIPSSKNGANDISNLDTCCAICNQMKSAMTREEFLSHIRRISSHVGLIKE